MIFRPELVDLILSAKKIETRRPVKNDTPCRYQPFRSYALQPGRGKKAVGRIRIRSVHQEQLVEIDDAGAIREGFTDRTAFLDDWQQLYGKLDLNTPVWVISFFLIMEREEPEPGEANVIEFEPEKHRRRRGKTFLLQGRQYSEMDLIGLQEGVSMAEVLGRALKLYKYVHDLKSKGGAVELIDNQGARWIFEGWDEKAEN